MRFAVSYPGKALRLVRKLTDWPLAFRFAAAIFPVGVCVTAIAIWGGYQAASGVLRESLEALPLYEAKIQADKMRENLKLLRHSLFRIAQMKEIDAQELHDNISLYFQDNAVLIREIGFKRKDGEGFVLLREGQNWEEYRTLSVLDASHGPYSPFQQILASLPSPGEASLLPVVSHDYPTPDGADLKRYGPVMRMALTLPDETGFLFVGLSVESWRNRLAFPVQPDSPLRIPAQEGAFQLSFYFDVKGWILFEMSNSGSKVYLPDLARHGYAGDLGRAGFDAAFRPWAVHENFWHMVTEVTAGRAGSTTAPADKYRSVSLGSAGFLCYAPVLFAVKDGEAALPVGGVAFFETSMQPLTAFLRLANYSIGIISVVFVLLSLLVWRVGKKLAAPIRKMAKELRVMATAQGELRPVAVESACEEHQTLQHSVNTLISGAMVMQHDLMRINLEMRQARDLLPADLRQESHGPPPKAEFDLVGSSLLMREVRERMHKAARAGTDVLVWGETGTGKELVAAGIHKASSRKDGAYISINCGALDENLLLDTLFGHVKGAFTEAKTERKGAFLSADGGTLHLDEIANASSQVQQALLRALAVRRIRPLGSDAEISFNTRVVAATNVDLRECVRAGTFREDLYYRLAIISIETPPLRHRKEDIPELAAFCIHETCLQMARPEARLSRGALELITAHDWPGNVREFKNCVTRAVAFAEGDLILPQHIFLEQDAFRTYAKPIPPQMLAGRLKSPPLEDAENALNVWSNALLSGKTPPFPPKKAWQPPVALHSPAGEGHAAEFLWPAPPRARFTPFRSDNKSSEAEAAVVPDKATEPVPPSFADAGSGTAGLASFLSRDAFSLPLPDAASFASGGRRDMSLTDEDLALALGEDGTASALAGATPAEREASSPRYAGETEQDEGLLLFAASGTRARKETSAAAPPPGALHCLNERQLRGLEFLRENNEMTRTQYEEVAGQGLSARTAQNDLKELVGLGVLERVGAGPGVRYILRRHMELS